MRSAKRANGLKYNTPLDEKKEENNAETVITENAVKETIKENFFKKLARKNEDTIEKIMPEDKEHLTQNKIRLNEELMRRWIKTEKKENE